MEMIKKRSADYSEKKLDLVIIIDINNNKLKHKQTIPVCAKARFNCSPFSRQTNFSGLILKHIENKVI